MKRDVLCADDWLMHARSIRNIANRARLYGDAEGAQRLMDAARAMERRASLSAATANDPADIGITDDRWAREGSG